MWKFYCRIKIKQSSNDEGSNDLNSFLSTNFASYFLISFATQACATFDSDSNNDDEKKCHYHRYHAINVIIIWKRSEKRVKKCNFTLCNLVWTEKNKTIRARDKNYVILMRATQDNNIKSVRRRQDFELLSLSNWIWLRERERHLRGEFKFFSRSSSTLESISIDEKELRCCMTNNLS